MDRASHPDVVRQGPPAWRGHRACRVLWPGSPSVVARKSKGYAVFAPWGGVAPTSTAVEAIPPPPFTPVSITTRAALEQGGSS